MFNIINSINEKVKKYGLEKFLDEVVFLDKESVVEEESVNGLPTITVIHPNKSKTTFCLRQYCFSSTKNYQVMIDGCAMDSIDSDIERQLSEIAFKRNSTPILVSQIIIFDFDIDTAGSFTDYSINIEKTDFKYISRGLVYGQK